MHAERTGASGAPVATITISREHREAILDDVESIFDSASDLPLSLKKPEHHDWAHDLIWKLSICAGLLDQLGWQERGNADEYQLAVDADVARFMAGLETRSLGALEDYRGGTNRENFRVYEFSDEEWAEELASQRRVLNLDLDSLDVARRAQSAFREAVGS